MQIVEKLNEGLSRVFEITVPKAQLTEKLDNKVKELAPKMNIKGFRPGKVPAAHVRKMYGKELLSEIIQETLNESSQSTLEQNKIRPAGQPDLKPVGDWEKVMTGEADLAYELSVELMPDFTPVDPATLELERPVYEASDADIDEAVKTVADQTKNFETKTGKTPKAAEGDKLIIDFKGMIDGVAFEGGTAEDAPIDHWFRPIHPGL